MLIQTWASMQTQGHSSCSAALCQQTSERVSPAQLLLLLLADDERDCKQAMGSRIVWRKDCRKRLGATGPCVAPCAATRPTC